MGNLANWNAAQKRELILRTFEKPRYRANRELIAGYRILVDGPTMDFNRELIESGFLEIDPEFPDWKRFDESYWLPALKELCASRGLPKSGTKEILAKRLVADGASPPSRDYLRLSPKGKSMAIQRAEAASVLAGRAFSLLHARRFAEARKLVLDHEKCSPIFDPMFDTPRSARYFELLTTAWPSILREPDPATKNQFGFAVAEAHLFGRTAPIPRLETSNLADDVQVRMLSFRASHLETLENYQSVGYQAARLHTVIPPQTDPKAKQFAACSVCAAREGRVWKISEFPEVPFPDCIHALGCRCIESPEQFAGW